MDSFNKHHTGKNKTDDWLTPPEIVWGLGMFDLDPCACAVPRPWPTAKQHYSEKGLEKPWFGRVWLNPPYSQVKLWIAKLASHGNGIALIFARTETRYFVKHVWKQASAVYFIYGRLYFYTPNGKKSTFNAGAPSVLVSYGSENIGCLKDAPIDGKLIILEKNILTKTIGD